ncbi:hypothetical protein BGX38DRAFT_1274669 [Terfezia claveryi]|nr:hypothetical protein BGX38DRAFT_1274669 [Terfezia claveryi]
MHLAEKSACRNKEELEARVARLKELLAPGQDISARTANGPYSELNKENNNIMGATILMAKIFRRYHRSHEIPIPLNPTTFHYLKAQLVQRDESPGPYDKLQELAVAVWKVK